MTESNRGPSERGDAKSSILRAMQEKGVVNLDLSLRNVVGYMAQAPGVEGDLLVGVLHKLHDQGVVNLDSSMKKAVDAVNMKDLSKLEASLFANDNYCLVVKALK